MYFCLFAWRSIKVKNILYITLIVIFSITTISCSKKEDTDIEDSTTSDNSTSDNSTSDNSTTTENITISSSADNETVVFGQTYQYEFTTSGGTSSDNLTYSLSSGPDNMTISSTGLVEWTPTKSTDIATHTITITVTTASGQTLTQTYDLVVTGTCVSGNLLAIWTGDQRSSTDSSKFLGNITAYTDNGSDICGPSDNLDCTAYNNYDYRNAEVNKTWGPQPVADMGNMFFYNQIDNASYTYLFWFFGTDTNHSYGTTVHIDAYTVGNTISDNVTVSDDNWNNSPWETIQESQTQSGGLYSSTYTTRAKYNNNYSDGAVIGPFSGSSYRIFIDLGGKSGLTSSHSTSTAENTEASGVSGNDLGLGDLSSFKFWSKDNSSFSLGNVDNFTIGFKTSVTCQ